MGYSEDGCSTNLGGGFQLVMGVPQQWMVLKEKSYLEMDENWGYPYDDGNLHMEIHHYYIPCGK